MGSRLRRAMIDANHGDDRPDVVGIEGRFLPSGTVQLNQPPLLLDLLPKETRLVGGIVEISS